VKQLEAIRLLVALGSLSLATNAGAQCRPPANSHEARLLAFYEAPIVFSMPAAPERMTAGAIRLGGEMIPVPSPNPSLQHPEYCYANTTNNTRLASIFGRPRLTIGLPAGLAIEGSYLPNVTVSAAEANLVSAALTYTKSFIANRLALAARLDGTTGRVRGAITCPQRSLQTRDQNIPCYGSEPSRDSFDPNSVGFEAALGARVAAGRLALYAGGGARSLHPHFQAGFTDELGNVDRTTVDVALMRATAFAGATTRLRDRVFVSMQLYTVPADATTLRVGAEYALR